MSPVPNKDNARARAVSLLIMSEDGSVLHNDKVSYAVEIISDGGARGGLKY